MTDEQTHLEQSEISRIAARIDKPLVLVGLMGVGKSTVGRRLAALLGSDFVDADHEIEQAAQRSISEIFEEFGETYFREGERRVIARLMNEGSGVIATGGGAFVDKETRELILAQGIAIWIDCSIDVLVERTGRRDTRPLLRTADPRATLESLYNQRVPEYAKADLRVPCAPPVSIEQMAQRVVDVLLTRPDVVELSDA